MLFRLMLVAALPFIVSAFPQNPNATPSKLNRLSQVDGFVFDGPTASRPSDGQQRFTSTSTTSTTSTTISTESTSTESMSTNINTMTTSLPEAQFDACVASCPVTIEYNPICGTDNMDYTNPGGLGCAQRCGKEVELRHYGRCSTGRAG